MTISPCSGSGRCVSTGILLTLVLSAAGCADPAPRQYVFGGKTYTLGKDVVCLERETSDFNMPYYRAVTVCGTRVPDLTGDGKLQEVAWGWQLPFTIRPEADTAIKAKFPYTGTGTLIANVSPDRIFSGGPFE